MPIAPQFIDSVVVAIREGLTTQGWSLVDWPSDQPALQLAEKLGTPIPSRLEGPLVDTLRPVSQEEAAPRSLSAMWGLGSFPFHTDGSAQRRPPRYVLLRLASGSSSQRPTLLQDYHALPLGSTTKKSLARDVWLVNGGRGRFLTSILNSTLISGSTILRFDMACMRPCSAPSGAAQALQEACLSTPAVISWQLGKLLAFDNWRVLHARGATTSTDPESDRVLERISVDA